ncbi:MAG: hypothetical protein R2742_14985 [Micropruina glycogenica]
MIVGWDGKGIDIDSDERPSAADLLASRMVSLSLLHEADSATEELKVTWLYLPRRLGNPARPHQVFLALGGALSIDQVLNPQRSSHSPEWRFRVGLKSDAGAALLISGDGVEASPEASGLQASFGYVATPDSSGISYALPRATGMRVELGGLSFLLTLSATGARVLAVFDSCALVVDGSSADSSFMRKLLGGRPAPHDVRFQPGLRLEPRLHSRTAPGERQGRHRRHRAVRLGRAGGAVRPRLDPAAGRRRRAGHQPARGWCCGWPGAVRTPPPPAGRSPRAG